MRRGVHGGVKFYRGSASAARSYVEADRSRVDDYYLAEGTGVARRYVAGPDNGAHGGVHEVAALDGDAYERWVAGYDVDTGAAKGRLRTDERGLRFVEVVVNGPKTWSLVASVHPEIAAAYDAAQDRAAEEIIAWLGEHTTTRMGPRGRQVQVPVERLEAAVVRHYTSRAGDPHRHLHLQVNARVYAAGRWRGLHSVGVVDSIEAINGIGHAAVACDPQFRATLAAHGYTLDPDTGEITQLVPYAGAFSARTAQIGRHLDRYEARWRADHPGEEPGPALRRGWDRRAWADARPDKVVPVDGAQLARCWREELRDLGFIPPRPPEQSVARLGTPVGRLNRDAVVEVTLSRLGARRSAWNAADIRGEVERIVASVDVVAEPAARRELVEDLTHRAVNCCKPLLTGDHVPEHVRSLTSTRVLDAEADLVTRLVDRADHPGAPARVGGVVADCDLDPAQQQVVAALAGTGPLVVVEGAAGAGKTTTLAAANELLTMAEQRLLVATPTLKAARVAEEQIGTMACSAAWLAYQHGYRWDEDGHWTREEVPREHLAVGARLLPGDLLLVDEAGMLDQDTAAALLAIADESGARVAFMGDRHQLPAVGRGGVLDHAARWARPDACLELGTVHRFTDPDYADLSLLMRTGERPGAVFDALAERGQIRVHSSEVERVAALTEAEGLVMADTRDQVAALNAAIGDHRRADTPTVGGEALTRALTTKAGERLGVGDRVATRRNDRDLGVANRDIWTITDISEGGGLTVSGRNGDRTLPASYVAEHVELAYATTIHGAQGETVDQAHLLIGEATGAAAAYVGMTRGRHHNTCHLVAENVDEARAQWVETFSRDRADLGPAAAAERAAEDIERYGTRAPTRPLDEVLADLWAAWSRQADLQEQHQRLAGERDALDQVAAIRAHYAPERDRLVGEEADARRGWLQAHRQVIDLDAALTSETTDLQGRVWVAWRQDLSQAQRAAEVVREGAGRLGQRRRGVHDASADLTVFAERWQPAVRDLPTGPTELAEQVMWMHGRRVQGLLNDFVARQVADAHPEADQIRDAERTALNAFDCAERNRTQADEAMYAELRPYGRAAHTRDATSRLAEIAGELDGVERELCTATARVEALRGEPSLRTPTGEGLDGEHERWAADRAARQEAAAREAQQRHLGRQERRRIEPPSPSRSAPDRGRSIGR